MSTRLQPGTAPDPSAATKSESKMYYWHPNFTFHKQSTSSTNGEYYVYFNDAINKDHGKTTYSIEVTYNAAQSDSKASVKAFLCRKEGNEYWEVHPPYEAPSPKVKTSYFGTYDDCSDYAKKKNFYTSKGEYPFGFYLDGVKLEKFRSTLLDASKESVRIDEFFPTFVEWSKSNGLKNPDWYLNPSSK